MCDNDMSSFLSFCFFSAIISVGMSLLVAVCVRAIDRIFIKSTVCFQRQSGQFSLLVHYNVSYTAFTMEIMFVVRMRGKGGREQRTGRPRIRP